jgi:CBS domain-containing protein
LLWATVLQKATLGEAAMQIKDIIRNRQAISVHDDDTLAVAIQTMFDEKVRHLPVTRARLVVGVISERDALAFRAKCPHLPCDEPVKSVMSYPAVVVAPETKVEEAVALMLKRRLGCLPVLAGAKLVGIVTRTDLLRHWPGSPVGREAEAQRPAAPKVRDLMSANLLRVHEGDDLASAAATMSRAETRHLAVVAADGAEIVGVLSERDILRHRAEWGQAGLRDPVSRAMSRPAVTVDAGEELGTAEILMLPRRLGCLPVLERGQLVGMLTTTDLVRGALEDQREQRGPEAPHATAPR